MLFTCEQSQAPGSVINDLLPCHTISGSSRTCLHVIVLNLGDFWKIFLAELARPISSLSRAKKD